MLPDQEHLAPKQLYERYEALRKYVGWQSGDEQRIQSAAPIVLRHLDKLVDDFYTQLTSYEETRKSIPGGAQQIERLKATLANWLRELLTGKYDQDYVMRRWLVGWRHVEIGLRQVYVNVALSRLRGGILTAVHDDFPGSDEERFAIESALNRALDLDLAIIQDAYESETHTRSEAAFRSLVESADCAIFILREDYRIAYLNPFAQKMTGYGLSEVEKRDFLELLVTPLQRDSVVADFVNVEQGEPTLDRELTVVSRDGSKHQLVWNVRKINEFAGAVGILGVGHDITDLQQAQHRAVQAERLAAIGQTMAGLAHESRNAFQRIQACLEMLLMEVDDRPEALQSVQRIQRALNQLNQLNEEVRSYAAPIRLEKQTCDLRLLWREAWRNLEIDRRDKQVELREPNSRSPIACECDPFAIGQVIRNAFENAIAACPDSDGAIEVGIHNPAPTGDATAVMLSIRDNGQGIQQEAMPRVFEPFFTTKTKGTGLGMAIAKRIIDAHEGTIVAKNGQHGGAEILISLPAKPPNTTEQVRSF